MVAENGFEKKQRQVKKKHKKQLSGRFRLSEYQAHVNRSLSKQESLRGFVRSS